MHKLHSFFITRILKLKKTRNNKQAFDVTIDFWGTMSVSVVVDKDYVLSPLDETVQRLRIIEE